MKVIDFFHKIIANKISVDACYFLFAISNKISPLYVFEEKCIRELLENELVTFETINNIRNFTITKKGLLLMSDIGESIDKIKLKSVSDSDILGKEFKLMIDKYQELFPKEKIISANGSSRYLRCQPGNLITNFKWFFSKYKYSWNEIIQATEKYINEQSQSAIPYEFAKSSQYFICKGNYNTKTSLLADYCLRIDEKEDNNPFKEKIV